MQTQEYDSQVVDVTNSYRHEPIVEMVSEVSANFNALTLEDTVGVTEDQDADPTDNAWESNDDKSNALILLSPEKQINSSLNTSSTDGSSLELLEYSMTSTSTTADSASIHSESVPELQDIQENDNEDSMVIMIDNLEVVSESIKGRTGGCNFCAQVGHEVPKRQSSNVEMMLADIKQLEFTATMVVARR